jgi:hypothetical protein
MAGYPQWPSNATINPSKMSRDQLDPTDLKSPGPDWEWRGTGPIGSEKGSWFNPKTNEYLRADPLHGAPEGPHLDYRGPDGSEWRIWQDGTVAPK